jgi:hypothetical protein
MTVLQHGLVFVSVMSVNEQILARIRHIVRTGLGVGGVDRLYRDWARVQMQTLERKADRGKMPRTIHRGR